MILLNLLSQAEKNKVKKIKIYFIIKNVSFLLISVLIICSTILLFSYLLVKNHDQITTNSILSEEKMIELGQASSIETATKELNNQLQLANAIQIKYIRWTNSIGSFSRAIPDGIILEKIELNSDTKSFRITGIAKQRNDLLTLQDKLNGMSYLSGVTSPISSLSQKENVIFDISGQLTDKIYE